MESDTPETDKWIETQPPTLFLARRQMEKLERQRNIAIAEIERILNNYGHKSDADCNCDDCEHIRPIELALDKVKFLANVPEHSTPRKTTKDDA